jgi:hypothetical protein
MLYEEKSGNTGAIRQIRIFFGVFYSRPVYFLMVWYIFPVWYVAPRKIWQHRCHSADPAEFFFLSLVSISDLKAAD